ncbi:MAG: YdeI/OmpD-associated family protein [Chitinophagales bacterium]|nr:YdeI/OmpD-associated family protein [Chitinophagales bacterium]
MNGTNPKTDFFFDKPSQWQKEYEQLRKIALSCGLVEELKWGCPCYTYDGANIVLIHGFKEYCAFLLFKGVLLADPKGILIQQTENVQAGRHIRFTNVKEIVKLAPTLKAYIYEATEVEKAGLKVPMKKTKDYPVPEEFQARLDKDKALKAAFEALTPGRQRAYLFHFAQAKQAKTRESRIDKYTPDIMKGKGLND